MSNLQIHWSIVIVAFVGACLQQHVLAQDICTKFNLHGPCDSLPLNRSTTQEFLSVPPASNPFCSLACSEGNAELFSSVCPCAVPVPTPEFLYTSLKSTTTITPTTTPKPVTCYYSSQRPAQFNSVARRVFSSEPVATECNYPGIVALFREDKGKLNYVCMGNLLDDDLVLISEKNCLTWIQKYTIYVMADSYQLSKVTKAVRVNKATATRLDTTGSLKSLYTVKLSSKLTRDGGCVQPVCVPNVNIPVSDIDLEDCRIVGYGDTTNTAGSISSRLNEIKVKVTPSTTSRTNLTITRVDKQTGTSCMSDDSAPLICSHKTTGEWVTVGITVTVGYPCSRPAFSPAFSKPVIVSLLKEAHGSAYYNALQKFKYADPTVFSDYMSSNIAY